jgi:hypothetical protein
MRNGEAKVDAAIGQFGDENLQGGVVNHPRR